MSNLPVAKKTMTQLVADINELIAECESLSLECRKPAGPKTFSTKAKAIAAFNDLNRILDEAKIFAKKTAKKSKAAKKVEKKSDSKRGEVRRLCEDLLMKVVDDNGDGLSYGEIIEAVREELPEAKTSVNCLRWYATNMRGRGMIVPYRPRTKKGD